jgi:hypothetical protein
MAAYGKILAVLDSFTTPEIETLAARPRGAAEHLRGVLRSKHIVGVGIAEKISDEKRTGDLALVFYVKRKVSLRRLSAAEMVPPTVHAVLSPERPIPTDVVAIGVIRPQILKTRDPVQPGNSIGHVKVTAGTLGAIVKRSGKLCALSNSHVLANSGRGAKGDTILYPGAVDGGVSPADKVGTLADFIRFAAGGGFDNRVDCAVAELNAAALAKLDKTIRELDIKPSGIVKAKRDMEIEKVGRTSGHTTGRIIDVNFRTRINYGTGVGLIGFLDQVLCTRYTEPGDSGALVLQKDTTKAVGLHFAGSSGGSVFNPIADVLANLGVGFA